MSGRLGASLELKLGQQLRLTPQLKQAIRLLGLSSLEIESEIREALESNPLLDEVEPGLDESASADSADSDEADLASGDDGETAEAVDAADEVLLEASAEDDRWDLVPSGRGDGFEPGEMADDGENLHDHLLWQLHLSPLSDRDRAIGQALIDGIGDDGMLAESVDAICAALAPQLTVVAAEVEAVLHRIQRFDPLGVGSRTLAECLQVQLAHCEEDEHGSVAAATQICESALALLGTRGVDAVARMLSMPRAKVRLAVERLRTLDPRPGSDFGGPGPGYVTPDVIVRREAAGWRVSAGPGLGQSITVNQQYEALIGGASQTDGEYLRGQLQEARWLLKSLDARRDTLLRVAACIVEMQQDYFEHGKEALRPLMLQDLAERLELHESTISRATTRKYMSTPRGTLEFKFFFSSALKTAAGADTSSTAVQAMLARLIAEEPPDRPLSDAALAAALKRDGIHVARRTVAKYREGLQIPSSNERHRL